MFLVAHNRAICNFVDQKLIYVCLASLVFARARGNHLQDIVLALDQFTHLLVKLPLLLQFQDKVCLHVIGDGLLDRLFVLDVRERGLSLALALEVLNELFYLFGVSGIHFNDMVY